MMALKFSYCEYQMYTFRRVEIDVLDSEKEILYSWRNRDERKVLKVEHKIISMLPFVNNQRFLTFITLVQTTRIFWISSFQAPLPLPWGNFETQQSPGRGITWLSRRHLFRKLKRYFLKFFFPSTRKRQAGVFKFLRTEENFRKAPVSRRMCVNGRNKWNSDFKILLLSGNVPLVTCMAGNVCCPTS